MKVKLRPLSPQSLRKKSATRAIDLPITEDTLLAVDMAISISLANKSIEEAKRVIELCKENLVFMEMWRKLGKEEKDLLKYLPKSEK